MTDAFLAHVFAPEIFLPYIGRGKGMYRGGGDIPFPLFAYRWLSVYPAAPYLQCPVLVTRRGKVS